MAPIKDEEAIGRTFILAIRSPLITSLLSLCVGGAGGSYFSSRGINAKLDQIQRATRDNAPDNERLLFLEETYTNHEFRLVKLEEDTARYYRRRPL